jgi:hypothetical protein
MDQFVNNKLTLKYGGNKEALFTIVDEEFPGMNHIGRVNLVTIAVRTVNADGSTGEASLQTSVIGIGNRVVGVMSSLPQLRGKRLNWENMHQCVVRLYE